MGRRRNIFTQREFEKLSKTHAGRKKIIKTYLAVAIFILIVSIGIIIGGYIDYLLEFFRTYAFISMSICLVVIVALLSCLKAENDSEQERIKKVKAEQEAKKEQQKRELEYQQMIAEIKAKEEEKRLRKFKNSNMDEIDKMNGYEFEMFVSAILNDLGYIGKTTHKSGDFGVDIIVEKGNEKFIIQTKRYSKKVSLSAVQEVTSAKNFYNIQNAWVVTNNYFTSPAKSLAKANSIRLIDRDELANIIIEAKNMRNSNKTSA